MEKLPVEFKQKWVAALKSGEYTQGRSALYSAILDSYCCLGVACVIADVPKSCLDNFGMPEETLDETEFPLLPPVLLNDNDITNILTSMNDGVKNSCNPEGRKFSFEEIAEWINENL